MWEDKHVHHANQLETVLNLKSVDISDSSIETSDYHHSHTRQLRDIVDKWITNFTDLMNYQKEYINALYSWLKLNLIPIACMCLDGSNWFGAGSTQIGRCLDRRSPT